MDSVSLTVDGVSVNLGGRKILRDVSLVAYPGQVAGLIGPNGAGKTTLMRTILGLIRPAHGQILVGDKPVTRGSIGYIPQSHDVAWNLPLTVSDMVLTGLTRQIGLFRRPSVHQWVAVEKALVRTGMDHMANRPMGELSGGQKQRVLIARALAADPAVLLLDEPMNGVDMPTQEMLVGLLRQLAQEGHTIMMSTHDLVSAMATMDRINLLNGTLVASGSPDQLRDASVWMDAFQISESNPLVAALGLTSGHVEATTYA